jgi:hypothetical protein
VFRWSLFAIARESSVAPWSQPCQGQKDENSVPKVITPPFSHPPCSVLTVLRSRLTPALLLMPLVLGSLFVHSPHRDQVHFGKVRRTGLFWVLGANGKCATAPIFSCGSGAVQI